MRRIVPVVVVLLALLAFAPAVSADTAPLPRETFESVGFDAFNSECDARTCTDTFIYASEQTTSSGESFSYVCVDRFTYNLRTGRGSGGSGCTESADLTMAEDLSSATLAPTDIDFCDGRQCETITVSAELQGTGDTTTFRGRFTERDGTCTYTYADSGARRSATGTLTLDGSNIAIDGSIYTSRTTVTSKCR